MTAYFLTFMTLLLRAILFGLGTRPGKLKIGICLAVFLLSAGVCLTAANLFPLIVAVSLILVIHINQEILCTLKPEKSELLKMAGLMISLFLLFVFLQPVAVSSEQGLIDSVLQSLESAYSGTIGMYPGAFKGFLAVVSGLLFVTFEVNHFILFILGICHLPPSKPKGKADPQILARGRIIGFAERSLIFTLVLLNQITAVGFVMAAKAFSRFRDMEKKEWAEYVLIGTLISTIFSFAVSLAVKALL